MKLGIYEVGLIPYIYKRQYQELKSYSQWQYLGKNLIATFLIALLDYFIANNKSQAIEQLAKPKRSYKKEYNQQIAQQIYNLRIKNINTKEFFNFLKNIDNNNQKGQQLLEEFCDLQELRNSTTSEKTTIDSIAKFYSISVNLIGQYSLGYATNGSPLIQYINQPNQQCQLCLRRVDDYFINSDCLHIFCKKCLTDKVKKGNQNLFVQCVNGCREKILIKDIDQYLNDELRIEVQKSQKDQQLNLQKSQQQQLTNDIPKDYGSNTEVLDKNQKTILVQYNNLIDQSQQQCHYCYHISTNQLYINKQCNHRFCIDCFKQRITYKGQKCVVDGCDKLIDDFLFSQREQLEDDKYKNQKVVQTQKQQLQKCSKCNNETTQSSLYNDKKCKHFICFTCIHQHVQKLIQNQPNHQTFTCPLCNNKYGRDFETFYYQQQLCLIEERIKFEEQFQKEKEERELKESQTLQQQQQQQQIQPQKVEKYPSRFINYQQQQVLEQNEKQHNSQIANNQLLQQTQENQILKESIQFEQGECTMCFTNFSEYNLKQEVDCTQHKIGVCCSIKFLKCPQCEQKKVYSQIIRVKPKLILQTFIQKVELMSQSGIYNSSNIQYNYENVNDYSRLNSRANVGQSQIKSQQRNSTMDANVFRSQASQSKVVGTYGAGYKY